MNLEALVAEIGPGHEDTSESANSARYDALRRSDPEALAEAFEAFAPQFLNGVTLTADGAQLEPEIVGIDVPPVGDTDLPRESRISLAGDLPPGAQALTWQWAADFGPSVVLAGEPGGEDDYNVYLEAGQASDPIAVSGRPPQSLWSIAINYMEVGFAHILPKGLDHILFVVGLFLLTPRFHALAWQISAFTVAHTITLALATLGLVRVSPAIVEPLIALSIVYVAVENLFTDRLHRWRPLVVFAFGLLHGLGFAGVLSEIGLSPSHLAVSLIAFNVGVELGQLTVIALCFLAVGFWFRSRSWYRAMITVPASVVVAAVGAYWFVERVV